MLRMQPDTVDIQLVDAPVRYRPIERFPIDCGGECVFVGRTRKEIHSVHGELLRLSYEAYHPMALDVLNQLAAEATRKFECRFIRIHHTIGVVPLGEASVIVQTACVRRAAAFEACRFLIDELKTMAPIWKREEWADGSTWSAGTPVHMECT